MFAKTERTTINALIVVLSIHPPHSQDFFGGEFLTKNKYFGIFSCSFVFSFFIRKFVGNKQHTKAIYPSKWGHSSPIFLITKQ